LRRGRADRLHKLVNKKVPRPWKKSTQESAEKTEPSTRPSYQETRKAVEDLRKNILLQRAASRPLPSRRARLRSMKATLSDLYATE
jgi:hypothetical protein